MKIKGLSITWRAGNTTRNPPTRRLPLPHRLPALEDHRLSEL